MIVTKEMITTIEKYIAFVFASTKRLKIGVSIENKES